MINMYLSMYGMATGSAAQQPAPKTAPKAIAQTRVTTPKEATATPQKIYLRVPDMSGEVFKKAKNMVDIFNEGTIKVIFYDSSTAKYSARKKGATTNCAIRSLGSTVCGSFEWLCNATITSPR